MGGVIVSVLIIGKFKGDTAKFRQALVDRPDEFAKIAEVSGMRLRCCWCACGQ